MKLTEKIAYLQGLMDGLELDETSKEGKILAQMADVLEDVGCYIEDLQIQIDELTELSEELDQDLGDVEEVIYGCGDDCDCESCCDCDDCCDDDEDYGFEDDDLMYEVCCPNCGDTILLDEGMMEEGEIDCPNCHESLEFDYDDILPEGSREDASEDEE